MPQPKKTASPPSARRSATRKPAAAGKPAAAKKPAAAATKPAAAKKTAAATRKPATTKRTSATSTRSTTAKRPAAAKTKVGPAKPRAKTNASANAKATPRPAAAPTTSEEVIANLSALRDRLVSSITLTTDRLQDAVDDAVRRGRMTRKDAEDLLATLVTAGRAQTDALLADVEQLLGRGIAVRNRAAVAGDEVLRTVDRARRRVGVGGFPILNYDELTAAQITGRLSELTPAQLRKVRDHERRHDARKSVLSAIEKQLG